VCEKCKKSFPRKDAYTKHMQRKKPCITPTTKNIIELNHDILLEKLNQQAEETAKLKLQMAELINMFKKYIEINPGRPQFSAQPANTGRPN
jgi:hypothetical protein